MNQAKIRNAPLLIVLLMFITVPLHAQVEETPEPERIELTASGDAVLVGDFYASSAETAQPGLLLMHQNRGRRGDWSRLLPTLLDAGYNILTVDLRGQGESGGPQNWTTAQEDTQAWLGWLSEQPTVDATRLGTIGASIGSNLALVGCAANESCVTAVALSPGLDYFGVLTEEPVSDMGRRSVMLVAANDDVQSANDVVSLAGAAGRRMTVGIQLFPSTAHGTTLLLAYPELNTILAGWLERAFAVGS